METIRIATVQFENKNGDKEYNLDCIESFASQAAVNGSMAIAFHECSVTGYSFARKLTLKQMLDVAEQIPGSESIKRLTTIAKRYKIAVLAGGYRYKKARRPELYKDILVRDHKPELKVDWLHPEKNKSIFFTLQNGNLVCP